MNDPVSPLQFFYSKFFYSYYSYTVFLLAFDFLGKIWLQIVPNRNGRRITEFVGVGNSRPLFHALFFKTQFSRKKNSWFFPDVFVSSIFSGFVKFVFPQIRRQKFTLFLIWRCVGRKGFYAFLCLFLRKIKFSVIFFISLPDFRPNFCQTIFCLTIFLSAKLQPLISCLPPYHRPNTRISPQNDRIILKAKSAPFDGHHANEKFANAEPETEIGKKKWPLTSRNFKTGIWRANVCKSSWRVGVGQRFAVRQFPRGQICLAAAAAWIIDSFYAAKSDKTDKSIKIIIPITGNDHPAGRGVRWHVEKIARIFTSENP